MNLSERTEALLAVVARFRAEQRSALLQPAAAEARAIVKQAITAARHRVQNAVDEERKRVRQAIASAEAALATERRLNDQHCAMVRLQQAWPRLRDALAERWIDTSGREHWVRSQLARATEQLAGASWHIRHHPAWTAAERDAIVVDLKRRGVDEVKFEEDRSLAAGFVVTSGHNVLDASLDGLIADRAAIEGRLLQLIDEGTS